MLTPKSQNAAGEKSGQLNASTLESLIKQLRGKNDGSNISAAISTASNQGGRRKYSNMSNFGGMNPSSPLLGNNYQSAINAQLHSLMKQGGLPGTPA